MNNQYKYKLFSQLMMKYGYINKAIYNCVVLEMSASEVLKNINLLDKESYKNSNKIFNIFLKRQLENDKVTMSLNIEHRCKEYTIWNIIIIQKIKYKTINNIYCLLIDPLKYTLYKEENNKKLHKKLLKKDLKSITEIRNMIKPVSSDYITEIISQNMINILKHRCEII